MSEAVKPTAPLLNLLMRKEGRRRGLGRPRKDGPLQNALDCFGDGEYWEFCEKVLPARCEDIERRRKTRCKCYQLFLGPNAFRNKEIVWSCFGEILPLPLDQLKIACDMKWRQADLHDKNFRKTHGKKPPRACIDIQPLGAMICRDKFSRLVGLGMYQLKNFKWKKEDVLPEELQTDQWKVKLPEDAVGPLTGAPGELPNITAQLKATGCSQEEAFLESIRKQECYKTAPVENYNSNQKEKSAGIKKLLPPKHEYKKIQFVDDAAIKKVLGEDTSAIQSLTHSVNRVKLADSQPYDKFLDWASDTAKSGISNKLPFLDIAIRDSKYLTEEQKQSWIDILKENPTLLRNSDCSRLMEMLYQKHPELPDPWKTLFPAASFHDQAEDQKELSYYEAHVDTLDGHGVVVFHQLEGESWQLVGVRDTAINQKKARIVPGCDYEEYKKFKKGLDQKQRNQVLAVEQAMFAFCNRLKKQKYLGVQVRKLKAGQRLAMCAGIYPHSTIIPGGGRRSLVIFHEAVKAR